MTIGIFVLGIYVISVMHMHYRGTVRMPWIRQIMTHTNYLAPYNLLMDTFSKLPSRPFLNTNDIEGLDLIRKNWETIRDEALKLSEGGQISAATGLNDIGFNSFFRTGWKRFYLKWYDEYLPSAVEQCPNTVELLKQVPTIKAAMFASLPPGGYLKPHRDPFAGCLRYHLGLSTPNHENCYILVDGNRHVWKDGEDLVFDETYIHEAHNDTEEQRIIFFADVHRPMRSKIVEKINRFMCDKVMKATATQNNSNEKIGGLNKSFETLYSLRTYSKKVKRWNRKFYYLAKYVLFFALIYFLFLR